MQRTRLVQGQLIDGFLQVEEELDSDDAVASYAVVDLRESTNLALQLARVSVREDAGQRLYARAQRVARVRHPHVAEIVQTGTNDAGLPYVTYRRLSGCTVRLLTLRIGNLNEALSLRVARETAAGMLALEEAGVLRGLSMDNVFLVDDGGRGHVELVDLVFHDQQDDWQREFARLIVSMLAGDSDEGHVASVIAAETPFARVVEKAWHGSYVRIADLLEDLGGPPDSAQTLVGAMPGVGDLFLDRYEIVERIGYGGFASVFRAIDRDVGRSVALKFLRPQDRRYNVKRARRFSREARLLSELRDPHTITLFDFGETDDGILYMIFEFVAGLDMKEVLRRRGRLDEETVRHVMRQVLFSLREAHAAGIFHRDVKPHNIMVYEYGGDPFRAKLLDFGVAKASSSDPLTSGDLTAQGVMVGTPHYMSPEQLLGQPFVAASDLYSLAMVAYEMLTGTGTILGNDTQERVERALGQRGIDLPSDITVSGEFLGLLQRMTSSVVAERPQSVDEVLHLLDGLSEPAPHAEDVPSWGTTIAIVLLVVLVVGVVVYALV